MRHPLPDCETAERAGSISISVYIRVVSNLFSLLIGCGCRKRVHVGYVRDTRPMIVFPKFRVSFGHATTTASTTVPKSDPGPMQIARNKKIVGNSPVPGAFIMLRNKSTSQSRAVSRARRILAHGVME